MTWSLAASELRGCGDSARRGRSVRAGGARVERPQRSDRRVGALGRDACAIRVGAHDSFVPPMSGPGLGVVLEGEVRISRLRSAITAGLLELLRGENAAAVNRWRSGET